LRSAVRVYRWILEVFGIAALMRISFLFANLIAHWSEDNSYGLCATVGMVLVLVAIADEISA
jgi:hypothetical protein